MIEFLPWWEQFPGRLEHERAALQSLGITVHEDAQARAENVVKWAFVVPDAYTGQGDVQLVATFPELYPFLRPDVSAPELDMAHHQHPFGKNLCLIGRASAAWDTSNDLAWLVREQLRKALALGVSTERGGDEENQGEPFSEYYNTYAPNTMVLVDSSWTPTPAVASGTATVRVTGPMPMRTDSHCLFVVQTVKNMGGTSLFTMAEPITNQYQRTPEWEAHWTHLPEPIKASLPDELWDAAEAVAGPHPRPMSCNGTDFELRLISYPEEHSLNGKGTGWIFLVRELGQWKQISKKDSKSGNPAKRAPRRSSPTTHLVRAGRVGRADLTARLGDRTSLESKHVLLIGAGAIGSVIADQLSRAGTGALTIVDQDVLEPGNLTRHAGNMSLIGAYKSGAAAALANQANPFVRVEPVMLSVGSTVSGAAQRELLARAYAAADLIIDATAEVGVQRLTSALARQASKPWIGAWGTNGARGGAVVHIAATAQWCFSCFEWARLKDPVLQPPASSAPLTQPVGCAEPTFTGASYDLNEVSLHAVRTAVAALSARPTYDAAILSLPDASGADLPRWETASMALHPSCRHT